MSPSQQNSCLLRIQQTIWNWQGKQTFVKENDKKKKKINIYICWDIWMNFLPTNAFSLLKSCQLYVTAKYKASSCCKIEAVIQMYSVKSLLLKILQNSQKHPCARASFLIKLQLKRHSAQIFSCEYFKSFKNTFFYRTPPVAATGKIRISLWN